MGALEGASTSFDLRYIISAVRANMRLVVFVIIGAFVIALFVTMLQTPRYTATSTIQINDTGGRVLEGQDQGDQTLGAGPDTDRFLKTQTDVLKSRSLALSVAKRLKLMARPDFFAAQELKAPEPNTPTEVLQNRAASVLRANLTVVMPRDTRVVGIQFTSTDPRISAEVVNAYANEFIQSNLQRKFDSSSYARDFLASQLDEAKARLARSEQELNQYTRSQGLIIPRAISNGGTGAAAATSSGSVTTTSLLQLNMAANEATAKRITAEGRWNSIARSPLLNNQEVISNATVAGLLIQLSQAETALSEERARHLDDYPTVRAKKAQLDTINAQIARAANNVRSSIKADFEAALKTEAELKNQVRLLKADTLTEQDQTVQYGMLDREAQTNRELYDSLLSRYKQLNAIAGASLSNVSIIDAAEPPSAPSSPNLGKNLLIGLLVGVTLAMVLLVLKDQFDDSVRVPDDLESKLGLSLLGVIPGSVKDTPEEALSDPKSSLSEAYNSLRGALMYSTAGGLPQVIMVTSAQPSEGKSTTSYAVATSLARIGKSVLLIDADMRRPSIHRRIDSDNQAGLSNLLTSRDSVLSLVNKTDIDLLSVVTSGPVPPSPTELLSTPRMEEILQDAARHFDVVIIDTPPVLGLADAPVLAPLADGVIFVVEADRSRGGALKLAVRRLRNMRPIILGGVLTKFDAMKAGNQYYEYYGYNYYQYESSTD